jgi:hypothetical protein
MPIVKKEEKATKSYPEPFLRLADKAATLQVAQSYFRDLYDEARSEIEQYLADDNCPITVHIGEKGSNPKIDGVCTIILTQPERLDNRAAAQTVADLVSTGKINPADLVELISQVNKEALAKVVDSDTLKSLIKRNDDGDVPVQIAVRVDNEYKLAVHPYFEAMYATVSEKIDKQREPTAQLKIKSDKDDKKRNRKAA